jgi:Flp pilus assembly protein TadG
VNFETEQSRKRRIARWSEGQSAVEFAITIAGLLVLVLAITNFAMVISAYTFVCYSARDGTRYAAVRGATSPTPASASDISAFVLSEAAGLNPSQLSVQTTWTPDNQPNSSVAVQVQYNFQFQIPFVTLSPVTLSSNSKFVISQ